jgi:putative oxidoreductase
MRRASQLIELEEFKDDRFTDGPVWCIVASNHARHLADRSFFEQTLIFTPAGTAHMFVGLGLPGGLAHVIMAIEITTGIALIIGFWPRWAALVALPVLIGAIVFFHARNGFAYNAPKGGGWEYPAFRAVTLCVQVLIGDGAFALRGSPRLGVAGRASAIRAS